MRYWWRRALNILSLSLLFKRYSRTYCLDCKKHFPFKGMGKLVSSDHAYKRVKHKDHTIRVLGKLRGRPKNYRTMFPVWQRPAGLVVPDEFDLSPYCEETGDQGNEGSCTGWGWRGSYAVGTKLRKGQYPNKGWSARCAYNIARVTIEKRPNDEGAFCTDVAKGATAYGICTEAVWPYIPWENSNRKWTDDPTVVVHPDDLKKGQTKGWRIITNFEDIFAAIASYEDVYIGIDWYDNWMRLVGTYNMPAAKGSPVGGHSIHLYKYSKKTGRVRLQNSWGKVIWGVDGRGDMLITDLKKVFNSGEFLVITFSTSPDPQPGPKPDPDDWLDELKKLFEAFIKALTDLFGSMPKKSKKRKARR